MESGLISVDRWRNGSQAYFLTHMHSDHTRGLSGDWSQAPLYCSRTTASLFPSRFPGFDLSLLRVVPLSSWTSLSLRSPSSGSTVRLHFMAIDAHHCPGSVMFLFRGDFGCFLYTGDFRWDADAADEARNTLVDAINESPVDILYLDNTYCNPIYSFPSRQVAANLVADIIAAHPSHDIIIAVDSLGKEDLLVHVSRILNIKIWVWPERLRTMHLLGFQDIFTTDTSLTRVRAVPRYSFSIRTLEGLNTMCPTIGIMPSGLPWVKRPFKGDDKLSGSFLTASMKNETISAQKELQAAAVHKFHDYMYSVHYSDHSCYEEIAEFIKLVRPKSMKGIVVSSSSYVDPLYYFGRICGANQPPQVLLMRPDTAEEFRAVRIKSYSGSDKTRALAKGKKRKRDSHSSLKRNKKRARIQVKCAKIVEVD
ncbi:PREDICTED: 5' exonuclease Apollo-like [Camelina sativa]|uniref:Protein artemis n=1 Tax=Camelina sativa TaxID=90675 RepID=A0ABM0YD77_CAMSA|nr:PREDICTED: 5' exonuclease Apollo-like [Camelina sativa]